jgi:CDP-glycerol glycerophosphotransferase (TagB/SpsB family)
MSSIREAAECLVGFEGYLDASKPDAVFGLHENNFWVKILFYLAQQKGIKTYSLQEGIILEREESDLGKYTTGTDYTDILFSWSEYDKKFYSEPDKIVPTGPAHLDVWLETARHAVNCRSTILSIKRKLGIDPNSTLVVFAPPRLDLYKGDFTKTLDLLIDWTRDRGIALLLSLHPFQGEIEQLEKISEVYPHVLVRHDIDGLEYVFIADVLITQTSTLAIEAVLLDIPVIEIDIDYVGLEQPLWKHNAADLLEGENLDKISQVLQGNKVNPRKFVRDRFPLADGESAKRIMEYVMEAI